jgi:hypothetical protein
MPDATATVRTLLAELRPGWPVACGRQAVGAPELGARPAPGPGGLPAPSGAATAPSEESAVSAGSASEAERSRPGAAGAAAGREVEPIRLHAEWSASGLRLWLGADPGLPLARLVALLVRQLRPRCAELGSRLATVVCNGELVFDAEAPGEPSHLADSPTPPSRT